MHSSQYIAVKTIKSILFYVWKIEVHTPFFINFNFIAFHYIIIIKKLDILDISQASFWFTLLIRLCKRGNAKYPGCPNKMLVWLKPKINSREMLVKPHR